MSSGRCDVWIAAARPRTLPAAVAPVVVGSSLAFRDLRFDWRAATICLAFSLLVQIGTNFANDYYDFVRGTDTRERVGPRRAVAAGLVAPATMYRAMLGVFAASFVLGLTLVAWGGPWLIVVGVASVAAGIAYTGGPWPLAYHGLGDVFVFVFFGLVAVVATYFVQAGRVNANVILAAVPVGLLATNILLVNNYRDHDTDKRAGKRTLVVRMGRRAARAQFVGSLGVAFAMPVILAIRMRSWWCLLPVSALPMAWCHVRQLREGRTPREMIRLLEATGKLLALFAILSAAGFAL